MNDKDRVARLRSYKILDTDPGIEFDRITKLAANLFQTPISLVSLVDEERQWFKSRVGLNVSETPRSQSFCSVGIEDKDAVLVINDARKDERFKNNPLVIGKPDIVFYAGAPLVDSDGYALGSLCIIDTKPREFTESNKQILKDLATVVVDHIQTHLEKVALMQTQRTCIKLEDKIQEARIATLRKSQFLANMSHEIRTPLTSIISLAELLIDTKLDKEQKDDVKGILDSSLQLKHLIGEILDFSKIEAGKLSLNECDINIDQFLKEIKLAGKQITQEKNQLFEMESSDDLPKKLLLDRNRVLQVLTNLLSNASKFSPEGSKISLFIKLDDKSLIFSVKDQGIGVKADLHEQIFEPYVQSDSSLSRGFEGIGLGLPISRELAKLMHGSLNIIKKEEEESGTNFEFIIPIKLDTKQDIAGPIKLSNLKGKKILLAEDNDINRSAINRLLTNEGIIVTEAINGEEVIEQLEKQHFDIILLDIHMPKLNGLQVLAKLSADSKFEYPIAMLTACATKDEMDIAYGLGAKAFFTKPIQRDQFFKELNELI